MWPQCDQFLGREEDSQENKTVNKTVYLFLFFVLSLHQCFFRRFLLTLLGRSDITNRVLMNRMVEAATAAQRDLLQSNIHSLIHYSLHAAAEESFLSATNMINGCCWCTFRRISQRSYGTDEKQRTGGWKTKFTKLNFSSELSKASCFYAKLK